MTTTFFYDLTGRLIRSSSTDGSEYRYDYDLNNNLTKLYQGAAGSNRTTQYTYDADNRPVTTTAGGKTITDTYNATGTRANRTYGFTTPYTVALSYLPGANGSKTGMVQTYQNGSEDAYAYEYDANGNITSITQGWSQATYTYDLAPENWTSYNVRKKRKKTNKGAERRWQERTSQSSRSSSSYGK